MDTAARATWSSRLGFLLATVGSAVGLGSIWRFPYMVGENGGGAFVAAYLVGLVILILPLMTAEFVIGRRGGGSVVGSFQKVARQEGASPLWALVGVWGGVAGFLILSFYSVIGGETIAYIPLALNGSFEGATRETTAALLAALEGNPERLALYHGIFMALTMFVVASGVSSGIERAATILMPLLFILLIVLAIYAASIGDFGRAFRFFFEVDFSKLTPGMVLSAIGLGFFSIGVGIGLMVTYASYAAKNVNLNRIAIATIVADTVASLLAGFAIFPIVFGFGLQPDAGSSLMFVTLPVAFAQMPSGGIVGATFFLLLFISALASAMSALEMVVAWGVERGVSRPVAALLSGLVCWFVGLATVLSFSDWRDFHPLDGVPVIGNLNPFLIFDYITSNVMLPISGIAMAVFVGFVIRRSSVMSELGWRDSVKTKFWFWLIRIAAPIILAAIFISTIVRSMSAGE